MRQLLKSFVAGFLGVSLAISEAQTSERVVDIPTRPGVTQRMLVISPAAPKAAVILLAGGHGGLQISNGGSFGWGKENFLIRSRQLFADQGLVVAVIDAPSDRPSPAFLNGFRQRPQHVEDLRAVMAWLHANAKVPVWLVGTSNGTLSAAYAATELAASDGLDGVVLTSTVLTLERGRPVPEMPLQKIQVPVLVVHHEQDDCQYCSFTGIPPLMSKLGSAPKTKLLSYKGGVSKGDPCEPWAHHGYNGIERQVVQEVSAWISQK